MTSLSGKTIRWMFVDGPTAGATFEHTLNPDGSIVWRAVDGAFKGASRREKLYGAVRINDQTWAVSYLAESGHTLTVVLNFANHQATGFASNDKTWHQLSGTRVGCRAQRSASSSAAAASVFSSRYLTITGV